jgi:hypothetical protein
MDPYDHSILGRGSPEDWNPLRKSLGVTRQLAERVNVAAMSPHDELASTKFCLAQPGIAYIVFLPTGGEVSVDLSGVEKSLNVEWIHPVEGGITQAQPISGGKRQTVKAPSSEAVVLFLHSQAAAKP